MTIIPLNDENSKISMPNRLVHEPARLAILTVLSSCASSDFVFLQNVTGLSKGNLSVQLTNLEKAGVVVIKKEIVERKMRTSVSLTKRGTSEIEEYWKAMDAIRSSMIGRERRSSKRQQSSPLQPRYQHS
jgi:DNA-binding HxlR family transcriptional regulator